MASRIPQTSDDQVRDEQTATSSEIVRNFGQWRDRARDHPVYILHHGKPRLVLSSVQLMQRLCRRSGAEDWPGGDGELLELLGEIVILLDEQLRIVELNAAARRYFRLRGEAPLDPDLELILPPPFGTLLQRIARRVAKSGATERLDLENDCEGSRALHVTVAPSSGGVTIVGEDVSARIRADRVQASLGAVDAALTAAGGVAEVRINVRGFVDAPTLSFSKLSGLGEKLLASVRFVALFDIASRAAIGEVIEGIMRGGEPEGIEADLLLGGTRQLPVRIGFAPIRRNLTITAAKAVIVARAVPS